MRKELSREALEFARCKHASSCRYSTAQDIDIIREVTIDYWTKRNQTLDLDQELL